MKKRFDSIFESTYYTKSLEAIRKEKKEKVEGKGVKEKKKEFWQLNTPEVTPEVKRELEIISMRDYLDPKSFFKVV